MNPNHTQNPSGREIDNRQAACQVIIVGAGPVGLTLANLLGQHGIRTLVVEQEVFPPDAPRAVSLDDESLRIWQQCGLIDAIMPFVAQGEEGDEVFTYRTRTGKTIFSLVQQGRPYGYARGNVFLFHQVLKVLASGLSRFPHIECRSGWTFLNFQQQQDRVRLTVQDREGKKQEIDTAYLVGCDGGRSTIRNALDIRMLGSAYEESWLIADTFSPNQADQPPREGVEVWCDDRCPTATIPLPGGYRRWEFLLRRGENPAEFLDDASIQRLIARRKAPGDARVVRRLVHPYKACVAEHYSRGRVFLAGDAAHLSPPFAGQGMATGLRDAANLSWKLAHVLRGMAPPGLLDSYEKERHPHQERMLKLAQRMGRLMMPRLRVQAILIAFTFSLASRIKTIKNLLEIRGQKITPVYRQPGQRRSSKVGHYLIQPTIGTNRRLDDLLGKDYTVIAFDRSPESGLSAEERQFWEHNESTFLWIRPEGETRTAHRAFEHWLGGCQRRLLIVRPDRFIKEDRLLPD